MSANSDIRITVGQPGDIRQNLPFILNFESQKSHKRPKLIAFISSRRKLVDMLQFKYLINVHHHSIYVMPAVDSMSEAFVYLCNRKQHPNSNLTFTYLRTERRNTPLTLLNQVCPPKPFCNPKV